MLLFYNTERAVERCYSEVFSSLPIRCTIFGLTEGPCSFELGQTEASIGPSKPKAVRQRDINGPSLSLFRNVVAIEIRRRIAGLLEVKRRWKHALLIISIGPLTTNSQSSNTYVPNGHGGKDGFHSTSSTQQMAHGTFRAADVDL